MTSLDLRARIGMGTRSRRFASDDVDEPRDVSDPHTLQDETTPTVFERFRSIRWYLLTVTAFVVILLAYLTVVGSSIVPELLGNPFARITITHSVVAAAAYIFATKRAIARISGVDRLDLIKPDGLETWPGRFVPPGEDDGALRFIPYKGFTFLGHLSKPLRVGDLSPDLARRWKNANRDPEDPAVIRLDPDFGEHAFTDYGHVLAQISSGLKIDTFGRESVLEARLPDMADADRMGDLREQMEDLKDLVKHYENLAETFRQQRDNALESANRPLEEQIDQVLTWGERVAEAGRPRRRERRDEGDEIPPADRELEDLDGDLNE